MSCRAGDCPPGTAADSAFATVRQSATDAADARQRLGITAADLPQSPLVRTCGNRRTLEFAPGNIQSEMLLSRPDKLVLPYCRAMMAFALFVPQPRRILMVGLGGGSLAKFCHRHFPQADITVIELRADVIALRTAFCVPPDDARFRVVQADAADYLAAHPGSADVLLVDGFDADGLPPALGSGRFYADCRRALRPGGVMSLNIFSYDPHYRAMLRRLDMIFGAHVTSLEQVAGNNRILFALHAPYDAAPAPRVWPGPRLARWIGRHRGLGAGWLNRFLVRAIIIWLRLPSRAAK
jgi:spermidine synthase